MPTHVALLQITCAGRRPLCTDRFPVVWEHLVRAFGSRGGVLMEEPGLEPRGTARGAWVVAHTPLRVLSRLTLALARVRTQVGPSVVPLALSRRSLVGVVCSLSVASCCVCRFSRGRVGGASPRPAFQCVKGWWTRMPEHAWAHLGHVRVEARLGSGMAASMPEWTLSLARE